MRWSARKIYQKALQWLFWLGEDGERIFNKEWDVLIVLDGCRLDLMDEVAGEFGFHSNDSIVSADTTTREWMRSNFAEEFHDRMQETIYVCSNPYSEKLLSLDRFADLDEVWKYAWDDDLGTIPPRPVTDRAVVHGRKRHEERMIIHYMQPHYPFITETDSQLVRKGDRIGIGSMDEPKDSTVWDRLRRGELSRERVWSGYANNLRLVLEDVKLLLNNLDSEDVVITSDHGNAMGEWGIYGHPMHMPLSSLREAPWIRTDAVDSGEYAPDDWQNKNHKESAVEQRLRDLGYVDT